jgi:hypothetical protein
MDPDPSSPEQPFANIFEAFLSVPRPEREAEPKATARPAPNGADPLLGPLELIDRFVELEARAAAIRALDASTNLTREQAAYVRGKAEQQKHEATEAEHRAAKEPARQEMSLRERRVALRERTVKTIVLLVAVAFIMAFLVTCLLIGPWLFLPVGTGFGALAFLARGRIEEFAEQDGEGRTP